MGGTLERPQCEGCGQFVKRDWTPDYRWCDDCTIDWPLEVWKRHRSLDRFGAEAALRRVSHA